MTPPAEATGPYVAAFRAFTSNGAAGVPAWLKEVRETAIAHFVELGFPSMKQEAWRFTNTARIAETAFALSHGGADGGVAPLALAALSGAGTRSARAVFVDGSFAPELSSVGDLPRGVRVASLARALQTEPEVARTHLTHYAPYRDQASPFAALNTAFLADGAFVHVAAGVALDHPIELVFVASAGGDPVVSHPRTLVVLERGARVTVVERYGGLRDGLYWTNAVTEVVVGDEACLEHYRLQRESRQAYHVATTHTTQGRDSVLRLHPITLGAALARHDIHTALAGTGADLALNGFYLMRGKQHADHHTVIEHAQPDCASHEFFNGILGEHAHGVFTGRIIVRPGAQHTDSKQTNNNLLLSADARADSQPQLEIYADDVKCTHGSTMGPLDDTAMYYLQSRGLSPEAAAAMLTYGFAAEILGRMEHAGLRQELDQIIRGRLADRTAGGRRA